MAAPSCWSFCCSASPWGGGADGETLIGSLTRRGVVGAFGELMGRRWRWVGAMGLLCSLLIFCFYSVVGGWTLGYTGMALAGSCNRGTARH